MPTIEPAFSVLSARASRADSTVPLSSTAGRPEGVAFQVKVESSLIVSSTVSLPLVAFQVPTEYFATRAGIKLQVVPYKGSLPTVVPTDPLIYRFYELVSVYGTTFKALINEEYGDGIMSAIDFDMDMSRLPHEKGDRVKIVMSGKYLQYKTY